MEQLANITTIEVQQRNLFKEREFSSKARKPNGWTS